MPPLNRAATDGFELFSPGGATPYAMIHRIIHKEDASIVGVRISPVVPVAAPERSLHVPPHGIIVGDATAAFIEATADSSAAPTDFPTCTTVPVDLADLYTNAVVAWRALHVRVESCAQAGGLVNATVLASGIDFNTCQGNLIYFADGTSKQLGQCTGMGDIYYCKAEVGVG